MPFTPMMGQEFSGQFVRITKIEEGIVPLPPVEVGKIYPVLSKDRDGSVYPQDRILVIQSQGPGALPVTIWAKDETGQRTTFGIHYDHVQENGWPLRWTAEDEANHLKTACTCSVGDGNGPHATGCKRLSREAENSLKMMAECAPPTRSRKGGPRPQ